MEKARLLFVDDELDALELLEAAFEDDYEILTASDGKKAIEIINSNDIDLVITDLHMNPPNGMDVLKATKESDKDIPVIMVTAYGSTEKAIRATKQGAYQFITKPFKTDEVEVVIRRAIEKRRLKKENENLRLGITSQAKSDDSFYGIHTKSPRMINVIELIKKISRSEANVLIYGESGTGKELVANAIHRDGPRKKGPFIAINCAAIPENLLESELFGHKKGAFTGSIADKRGLFLEAQNGSLFLDEIGELPLALQAKLLRAIQSKTIKPVGDVNSYPVNCRIVCATNRDLKEEVKNGNFREDLYYRLSVLPVKIPPLKERKEDISHLANFFLNKFSPVGERINLSKDAMSKLLKQTWSGNVRELENVIERSVVLCRNNCIEEYDLLFDEEIMNEQESVGGFLEEMPTLKEIEEYYIKRVLDFTKGKKEEAAKILGINRRTLLRKEISYDLRH
jgi:DNA-binding NtrC family response regulator